MDLSDNFGRLCEIAKSGNDTKELESLLVSIRDVNDCDEDGHGPLWYAALRNAHVSLINILLEAGAQVTFDIVSEAVINNPNGEVAFLLFSKLPSVSQKELDLLFLLSSASNTNDRLVRFFHSKGADPNTKLPMDLYIEPRDEEDDEIDFDELWQSDDQAVEQNALVLTMYENPDPVPMLRTLLALGVDPNAVDSEGYPVLVHALDDVEVVKVLLDGGAQPNVVDSQGMTPLMHACAADMNEVSLLLLSYSDDPDRRSFTGETALHYALGCHLNDNSEVVRALLESGYNVNAPDGDGLLPLDVARFNYCSEEIIELLLSAGAKMSEVS